MRKNTLLALQESISGGGRIKKAVAHNCQSRERNEIRLNLVYLSYYFHIQEILIQYYVKDAEYPDIQMSFTDFIDFTGC
ncbi:hypothetical protein O0882_12450 [Janthinobacterium sp. SUN073]|uniref:hypothetical protein n=1 Tax=Janthinobacterium sp. SUN073 TaxID=3004102 RepID=UPI0025B148E0|nr:hypothetical protein [Janthinobacterium sp. SUN073]MDN2697127.1 hypothetical protein [Janthinobacterium sp. SUN073]